MITLRTFFLQIRALFSKGQRRPPPSPLLSYVFTAKGKLNNINSKRNNSITRKNKNDEDVNNDYKDRSCD